MARKNSDWVGKTSGRRNLEALFDQADDIDRREGLLDWLRNE